MKKPEKSIQKRKASIKRGLKRSNRDKKTAETKYLRKHSVQQEKLKKAREFEEQYRLLRGLSKK